ncbi:hypothetical protein JOC36_000798 [Weissella uvarum]|nr:hypothetical protein [Weissella uvarum]
MSLDEVMEQDFYEFLAVMNTSKADLIEDPRKMMQLFS